MNGMSNINIDNVKVLHTIIKAIKMNQTGLARLFLSKVEEEETTKVKELRFQKIDMDDLEFLGYFPNLEILKLDKITGIKDSTGLAYCCHLKELEIYDTYIDDLHSLDKCSELEYFDYICSEETYYCAREDFRFLRNLLKLYQIDLTGNKVEDISFLSGHQALEQLVLDRNPIRSIAPLKMINKLNWLEISGCGLSELEEIEHFPALTYLRAADNNFDADLITKYKEILKHIDTVEF